MKTLFPPKFGLRKVSSLPELSSLDGLAWRKWEEFKVEKEKMQNIKGKGEGERETGKE